MKSVWNGTVSFGLVHIPVKLYSATRSQELHFHYLHRHDLGRIRNERICTVCGQIVDINDLVRGYEYEKGQFVTLTAEDFNKIDIDSTRTLIIDAFVSLDEIDPIFFNKPYYLAPEGKSGRLYALLSEALTHTRKVALAKLAFHDRDHLAVIKATGRALMLDLLYFADEIASPKGLPLPRQHETPDDEEMKMAERLIAGMTEPFVAEKYVDAYRERLLNLIEKKRDGARIRSKSRPFLPATAAEDLLTVLKASVQKVEAKRKRALAA